jgi:hypothetical protein
MQPLFISATEMTPEIDFDRDKGYLGISGRGFTQKILTFYEPVLKWVDDYVKQPQDRTTVDLRLEYINSASTMVVANILKKINSLKSTGKEVIINWHYHEEEDMKEIGLEMELLLNLTFNYIVNA